MTDRKCNWCGVTKPIAEFSVDKNMAGGHKPYCKACRNARQRELKRLSAERARQEAQAYAAARDMTNVAAPRTYVTAEVWTPQDRTYYRNDGNKHIQSRGF